MTNARGNYEQNNHEQKPLHWKRIQKLAAKRSNILVNLTRHEKIPAAPLVYTGGCWPPDGPESECRGLGDR